MQLVDLEPATNWKQKRRNVQISDDTQSVAARHLTEMISEKIKNSTRTSSWWSQNGHS
ncbi:hypothetical protein HS088_TW22G01402 [Tripterygium wilfordii]|uniref:Uncharacterized protein n=1 Tax=Tripterygium wilfordii TaxID=458696 RepID=A0A7J7C193_TRIWF|nr:hypothetical protein HS088_TW22G01402 [Tripterygium wilfordii]